MLLDSELVQNNSLNDVKKDSKESDKNEVAKFSIVWETVIVFSYAHLGAIYGIYLAFTSAKIFTLLFAFGLHFFQILSISAGVHRLWTHRSYKAKWPLRLFLMLCNNVACQHSIYEWARNHRMHHKFSETNADPYNSMRGIFFSHLGWLMLRKHPELLIKGKQLDYSDMLADPIIRFQKKYYPILIIIFSFFLPTIIPWYFWNESLSNAWFICAMLRWCLGLNSVAVTNSIAHRWGLKPYDKNIYPSENVFVKLVTLGEGSHNFHHTFPYDYTSNELGKDTTNITTIFIDACAKFGLAYDLRAATEENIRKRILRTGYGSKDGIVEHIEKEY